MRAIIRAVLAPITVPARFYFWGGFMMVIFTAWVMSTQIGDRWGFANAELKRDVMERWGAPILQPAPSARYAQSGAVFNVLSPLAFDAQAIEVTAAMNYRKRGLVYFSGFEFAFKGSYRLTNPKPYPIDVVFVFPVQSQTNRILLSNLSFVVEGEPETLPLDVGTDKLVWTGRLKAGGSKHFQIGFSGQGLDRFAYHMDPNLPVKDFSLSMEIGGGDNYDYELGVVPAHSVELGEDSVNLGWRFESLESGVPVGVLLPSEKSFDAVIVTMAIRSWATFALFFLGLVLLAGYLGHRLERHESYLTAAIYAFFFVLLPYLAAYMSFYVAYALTSLVIGWLLYTFLTRVLSAPARPWLPALIVGFLNIPTLAVVFQEHTGLIYSLEILAALYGAVMLFSHTRFRELLRTETAPSGGITGGFIHEDDL